MLDARDHLLAHIAALGEVDAVQLVHVGFVREGVAIAEVEPAARDAERDAVRLVGLRLDQRGAEVGRRLLGKMRRQHHPRTEGGQARIGIDQAVIRDPLAIPQRQHAQRLREILDRDGRAQLVEIQLVDQGFCERARAVDEKAAAVRGRRLGHDAVGHDLSLRAEQRRKAGPFGRHAADIGREQPVQKASRRLAAHFDDAAVGKQCCLHVLDDPWRTLAKLCVGT